MRLDFNVLWVEDQPANVKSMEDSIGRKIGEQGFRLRVEYAKSVDAAKPFLSSDIYGDHIDLILMDYDLGSGAKGDDGIEEVRREFAYKDLVFYSAGSNVSEIVAKKQFDGVFCSTREHLIETVYGLFEALIKKVLDIDHARGIVMGASSDIDGLVFDCLAAQFAKSEDKLSKGALNIISARLTDIEERSKEAMERLKEATKVEHLRNLHNVYTSIDRFNLLRKLLEQEAGLASKAEQLKAYVQTAEKRNVLAHVRVKREGFSRKLIYKNGELTRDDIRAMRLDLLRHQEALESLVADLNKA